jgi:ribonuclease BN (tRNA processing enzyme)
LKRLYRELNNAFQGWLTPWGYRLTLTELGETTVRLPGYSVSTRRMNHYKTGAIGYRLAERGREALAYSGDTDVCQGIVDLGRNAELLILECSVRDEQKVPGHLTPTECGRIAAQADCRRLALTHFYPVFKGYDIRRRVRHSFGGRLTLARDFTSLTV